MIRKGTDAVCVTRARSVSPLPARARASSSAKSLRGLKELRCFAAGGEEGFSLQRHPMFREGPEGHGCGPPAALCLLSAGDGKHAEHGPVCVRRSRLNHGKRAVGSNAGGLLLLCL